MNRTILALPVLLLAPLIVPTRAADAPAAANDRMEEFRAAKFGMFIHWGLYAIPARGEWVMNRSKIPVAKYAEFAPQFNPVKFNAEEWVRVAKDAGMRYIVITSKHHDGFAMFGSKVSPYNIVDATPFKRDPLKELAAACQKEGIRLGFYYSQAQDWHHPGGAASGGKWDPSQQGDFDQYLQSIALPQVKELLTGYGPVFAVWFDTPVQMSRQRAEEFARLVHSMQPATLINSRLFHSGGKISSLKPEQLAELKQIGVDYLSYGDRQIPNQPQWRDWETCMTLNHSWGYTKSDDNWKSPETLVRQLVEIASKGGNFLLNVGPTAEGEIPAPSVRNLKAVGEWLKVNGEAIYGTGPSAFGNEPGKPVKPRARTHDTSAGTRNWWCTTKPGKLYIHLFQWPAGQFELRGVKSKVTKAYLLAGRDKLLPVTQEAEHVAVQLPAQAPDSIVTVLCLEHD
jgi:alpha-L-fucosidase